MSIPAFGLGTFRLQDQVVIDSVSQALKLGYRAIVLSIQHKYMKMKPPLAKLSQKVV